MRSKRRFYIVISLLIICLIICSIGVLCLRKEVLARKKKHSIIDSFTSRDIQYLDNSLEATTMIEYQEYKATYDNVRQNVVKAFEDNYYIMMPTAMYIDRKLDKNGKINRIRLIGWPKFNGKSIEFGITVEHIVNWNSTEITKISSENEMFGKIFFDK